MIRVTYDSIIEDLKKPEKTTARIFPGKLLIEYNIPGKAQQVVDRMKEEGRKGVIFSRGNVIEVFPGKSEDEILEIVKTDIDKGVYEAKEKAKKEIKIINLEIIKK
jgi:hypothetical protein